MTLGEILYIEAEASERDQILYACSAQEPKMLPKNRKSKNNKKEVGQQIKQRMGSVFDAYYAKHGKPENKKESY